MANEYINGSLHNASKTVSNGSRKTCSKCGEVHSTAWIISVVYGSTPHNREVARYCYACTGNHWKRAFSLYRKSLACNSQK